jgi:biotin carboxyl carrier protein
MAGIFPPLAMTMFGRSVSVEHRDAPADVWVISHASETFGRMECGTQNPYIVLRNVSNQATTMQLHPDVINRLFRCGRDSGITLLVNNTAGVQLKHVNKKIAPKAKQIELPLEPKAEPATETPKAKKGDKKEQARAIIAAMTGKSRKEIITAIVEQMGMTNAGASTYHYNLTKGAWK